MLQIIGFQNETLDHVNHIVINDIANPRFLK